MGIENTEKKITNIFSDFSRSSIVLPNFQRGFVWNRSKQKSFLASVLVNLPVGSLLMLNGESSDFAKRPLCQLNEVTGAREECAYVLDGQQRLSTLKSVFYDVFNGDIESEYHKIYPQLRTRWFLRVIPQEGEADHFGYNLLKTKEIEKLIDQDVLDFVEYRVVHRNKNSDPHHPNYRDDLSDLEKRNNVTSKFAADGVVPLWEVCLGVDGLHKRTLSKIADSKLSKLKEYLEQKEFSEEAYWKVFESLDEERVQDIYNRVENEGGGGERDIALAQPFAELKTTWVEWLTRQLVSMLDRNFPIIQMGQDEIDRAVAIFEAINRGGSPLSVYDLIVAKSAQEMQRTNLSLRISEIVSEPIKIGQNLSPAYVEARANDGEAYWSPSLMGLMDGKEPSSHLKEWFTNMLSLIVHVKNNQEEPKVEHIKKEKVLHLNAQEINDNYRRSVTAIIRALSFMHMRCGVISSSDIAYKLMLVVLGYHLDDDAKWEDPAALNKLEYWYWVSLFGGSYFAGQNERCIQDIRSLEDFLNNRDSVIPNRVNRVLDVEDFATEAILVRDDDTTEQEPRSVRNGLLQFTLSRRPVDFIPNGNDRLTTWDFLENNAKPEVHHIIPLGSVLRIRETSSQLRSDSKHPLNSPLNLIYISESANRSISSLSPARYFEELNMVLGALAALPSVEQCRQACESENYRELMRTRFHKMKEQIVNHVSGLY